MRRRGEVEEDWKGGGFDDRVGGGNAITFFDPYSADDDDPQTESQIPENASRLLLSSPITSIHKEGGGRDWWELRG